jgi:hypothetical protein
MNYLFISDCLWYSGHILSGIAAISSHYNFEISILLVFFGQFITIISRPIGRIKFIQNKTFISDLEYSNNDLEYSNNDLEYSNNDLEYSNNDLEYSNTEFKKKNNVHIII